MILLTAKHVLKLKNVIIFLKILQVSFEGSLQNLRKTSRSCYMGVTLSPPPPPRSELDVRICNRDNKYYGTRVENDRKLDPDLVE